ncbi:MAG: hypothetical protein J0M19_16850 [Sphingomonadales bacterium]|nr:hypothetical protein [Sphingomonadales bacterium]
MASSLLLALALIGSGSGAATVEQLEQTLAGQDSATAALRQWCAVRRLADEPQIRAVVISGRSSSPPGDLRRILRLGEDERLGYRHVKLSCGGTVLSEAHNWYATNRLSPEMNRALDDSDAPFGQVAAPLGFHRERLGGERGAADYCPAGTILSHRALLRLPDGRPLAYVVECYTAANLPAETPD